MNDALCRQEDRTVHTPLLILSRIASHLTFFNFGYPATRTTYNSYLLRYANTNDYNIFSPFVWNHMCLSWERGKEARIALVSVKIYLTNSTLNQIMPLFRMETS